MARKLHQLKSAACHSERGLVVFKPFRYVGSDPVCHGLANAMCDSRQPPQHAIDGRHDPTVNEEECWVLKDVTKGVMISMAQE